MSINRAIINSIKYASVVIVNIRLVSYCQSVKIAPLPNDNSDRTVNQYTSNIRLME